MPGDGRALTTATIDTTTTVADRVVDRSRYNQMRRDTMQRSRWSSLCTKQHKYFSAHSSDCHVGRLEASFGGLPQHGSASCVRYDVPYMHFTVHNSCDHMAVQQRESRHNHVISIVFLTILVDHEHPNGKIDSMIPATIPFVVNSQAVLYYYCAVGTNPCALR